MIISAGPLLGRLFEQGHYIARPDAPDLLSDRVEKLCSGSFFTDSGFRTDVRFKGEDHLLPCRFELVREYRDFCDVVRNGEIATAEPGKNPHVSGSGKVGTGKPPSSDLQFDAQQRVKDLGFVLALGNIERAGSGPQRPDLLGVDLGQCAGSVVRRVFK